MTMTKVACLLAFASLSRVGAFLPFAWHRAPSRAPRAARAAVVAVAPDKRLDSTIDELMNRMEERRPELMPQLLGKRLDVLTDSRFLPRLETRRTDQGVPPQQAAELEALGELVLSFLEELTDRVREIEPEWQQEQAQADAVTAKAAEKARAALRGLKSTPPRRRGGGADPAGAPPVPAVAPGQGATDEAAREVRAKKRFMLERLLDAANAGAGRLEAMLHDKRAELDAAFFEHLAWEVEEQKAKGNRKLLAVLEVVVQRACAEVECRGGGPEVALLSSLLQTSNSLVRREVYEREFNRGVRADGRDGADVAAALLELVTDTQLELEKQVMRGEQVDQQLLKMLRVLSVEIPEYTQGRE